jgi:hypothetical protein
MSHHNTRVKKLLPTPRIGYGLLGPRSFTHCHAISEHFPSLHVPFRVSPSTLNPPEQSQRQYYQDVVEDEVVM